MTEAIEEVIFPALGLIFLLLGIVLIASILYSAFNPYDQLAFAEAEKLRAAINEACFTGRVVEVSGIMLKQNTPSPLINGILTIVPMWLIKSSGDPNYLIYYEAFPPPEAVSWEIYHDFQNRIIVPLSDGYNGESGTKVADFVKYVLDEYKLRQGNQNKIVDEIIVSNIILSEAFRPDFVIKSGSRDDSQPFEIGGPQKPDNQRTTSEKFFAFGKWKNQDQKTKIPSDTKNQFIFSNYLGLSEIEKTSIKYAPCGDNSLCLKTRSGVYTFPLDQCRDIKAVQLLYDGRGDDKTFKKLGLDVSGGAVGTAIIKFAKKIGSKFLSVVGIVVTAGSAFDAVGDVVELFLAWKTGDFVLASPCTIQDEDEPIKIAETDCISSHPVQNLCEYSISYPLYKYNADSGKLENAGSHYACVQSVGKDASDKSSAFQPGDKCIRIIVETPVEDHCWTANPDKPTTFSGTVSRTVTIINGLPIPDNTEFVAYIKAVVLNPTKTALKQESNFFEALDRKWGWGWPM